MLTLLQVCNVGQITGGTAACAWTVARSLPDVRHKIVFRGSLSAETRQRFQDWEPEQWRQITRAQVARTRADLVLLHNISRESISRNGLRGTLDRPTVNYLHSRIAPAVADVWICCSEWLRERYGRPELQVVRQGVPRPPHVAEEIKGRRAAGQMRVGRLCTPTARMWWSGLPEFYAGLAHDFPTVAWEFVGCPAEMQSALHQACGRRAVFHPAGWDARRLLWSWDALLNHHPELTESFGRTVGDAFRSGCIPIVDRRGGFIEQIEGGPGYLCRDAEEFRGAVRELLDPERRRRESERCIAWGEAHYSLRAFGGELLRVFQEATERFPGRCPQAAR
ncbi:MAG: hypothetical protein U0903_18045 [Planctomycetales bacterium]